MSTNANTIAIYTRQVSKCLLLSFLTLGIYALYWQYLLIKNVKSIKKDSSGCGGELLCMMFIPAYIPYWWFVSGRHVKEEFAKRGFVAYGNEFVYLLLACGLVSMAIMQNDFNMLVQQRKSPANNAINQSP